MYYPYLRGRQNELLALRTFAELLEGDSFVFPIIEPVKENNNALKRSVYTLSEHNMHCGIVMNPQVGENEGKIIDLDNDDFFVKRESWFAVFILNSHNSKQIESIIHEKKYEGVLIVIPGSQVVDEDVVNELLSLPSVDSVVVDPSRFDIIDLGLKHNKKVVEFEEKFRARPAGKDYLHLDEEEFSQSFASYKRQGFSGFGDYTVIANEYRVGGSLPRVLVMHLTYKKSAYKIYIKHFCSHSNQEDGSNVQGKFEEAALEALSFFGSINYTGSGISMINEYIEKRAFPGLGVLKKISILHHIELVQRVLAEEL